MLSNGMLESQLSEIPLDNFSSAVMLSIFECLYTDAIVSYPPVHWRMGLELLSAAHFFDVPRVEAFARKFLLDELFSKSTGLIRVCPPVAMDMLSIALEFEETWDEKDDVMNRLGSYIRYEWFQDHCSLMSIHAVDFMFSSSLLNYVSKADEYGSCLEEYLNFRKIVLWLTYRALPHDSATAELVLEEVLPGRNSPSLWQKLVKVPDIDRYLTESSTSADECDSTAVLNNLLGASICKESLEYLLLRHVNLSRMPQSLLLEIVHPLQMFPVRKLLMALLHTALQRSVRFARGFYLSPCSLRIGSGERIIRSDEHILEDGVSMAVLALPEARSISCCKCSFQIRHYKIRSMDIGVICEPVGQPLQLDQLFTTLGQDLGDCPLARVLRVGKKKSKTLISRRGRGSKKTKSEDVGYESENEDEDEDGEENSGDENEVSKNRFLE